MSEREMQKKYPGSRACPDCRPCPECNLFVHETKPGEEWRAMKNRAMHAVTCSARALVEESP